MYTLCDRCGGKLEKIRVVRNIHGCICQKCQYKAAKEREKANKLLKATEYIGERFGHAITRFEEVPTNKMPLKASKLPLDKSLTP